MNHSSITEIRELLNDNGIALKKRFGQNFLVDHNIRMKLFAEIRAAWEEIEHHDGELWEIGPGLGSLTDLLHAADLPVRLFEIDYGIISLLRERYGDAIPIVAGDFLKTCAAVMDEAGRPSMIVGNLPYASASAIVSTIIETGCSTAVMVFLVQRELASRFVAKVGDKDYSALSVLVQNHYSTDVSFIVGGNAFYPRPEVESVVITMRRYANIPSPEESHATSMFARQAFSQRRKAIRNSLRDFMSILNACGIDPSLRPERIPPHDFLAMGREYLKLQRSEDQPLR